MINLTALGEHGTYLKILEEATVVKAACRRRTLAGEEKATNITKDDVTVSLLADLNEIQQAEVDKIISQLPHKVKRLNCAVNNDNYSSFMLYYCRTKLKSKAYMRSNCKVQIKENIIILSQYCLIQKLRNL